MLNLRGIVKKFPFFLVVIKKAVYLYQIIIKQQYEHNNSNHYRSLPLGS